MIFDGVEFVVNPDLPDDHQVRIGNGAVIEVTPRVYSLMQIIEAFDTHLIPTLAKLGRQSPEAQQLVEDFAPFAAEMRQVIDAMKRLPPRLVGYGCATLGNWTAENP